jgi:hypothetical protein
MRTTRVGLLVVCFLVAAIPSLAQVSASSQSAPQRDQQAIASIQQAITALGGLANGEVKNAVVQPACYSCPTILQPSSARFAMVRGGMKDRSEM